MTKSPIEQAREFLGDSLGDGNPTRTLDLRELLEYAESLERNQFSLDADQKKQIDEWIDTHDCSIGPYFGAIGGKYTYKFNPTGIGMCIECECACGKRINVTDSESW